MNVLMFSTIPRIGTFMFRNITSTRLAIVMATSCGVITMTTPDMARV